MQKQFLCGLEMIGKQMCLSEPMHRMKCPERQAKRVNTLF